MQEQRLFIPGNIASSEGAYEILSAWIYGAGTKIGAMSRTGTPLDHSPEVWGEVLASLANNIALSAEQEGFDRLEMLRRMKAAIDRNWERSTTSAGTYYPPPD